ncbi:M16 family metallopeptidase [Sphingomonas sp. CFBP 8760]|uniref:M16 family metallopeptidase n=1 Tax=Sphingomonas sp. CFBP 8760 TaxID=2775282 RepID=UPI0017815A58|nr:pitrilysin family protein [Sphingomonas sp. CFBP 8760]MBD8548638.1 insulinase family protein [Sphingomonas sp. CFBP 8760]
MRCFLSRCGIAALLAGTMLAPATAQRRAIVPAPAPAAITVPPIGFTERTLANGLKVIAIRDTSTPNVTTQVWYDVGSKHDPQGRSGFAHLFEHILSRKTVNMPYNAINKLTEDVGGSRNASTWFDRTNYYEIVPAQYLETMLWTHAERMARPMVDEQVFETERNVVKEEFRQRVLAPPYGRLRLVLDENSYDTLPMRRSGIGSLEQLDAATLADARAFHEAFYGPDTATLIVSGNFDPARLDGLVDRYFGAIPRRGNPIPLKVTATEAPRTTPRIVTAYAPNVPLAMVASSWRIPGAAHSDLAALEVLDAVLSNGENSRLYRALVRGRQIAASVGVQLQDVEDGGFFAPSVTLASSHTVAEAEPALAAEIARMRDEPVTAAELAEAKNEILAAALRERETFDGRAFAIGEALVRTGDPRALDRRLALVGKVTAADVQRVARLYLKPEARIDIRYLDEKQRPAGAANGWTNPTPMPTWASVPPAARPPLALAPEASRQAPPPPGRALPVTPPAIVESTLANSMGMVAARTGSVPVATMAIVFRGGAATDPRDRAGLAALLADIATQGTRNRTAEQIAAQVEALGARLDAQAGADGTVVSITGPVATLAEAGAVLADVVRNATFPADEVERRRDQTLDGLSVALKNPGALAAMAIQPVSYGAAPYGAVATSVSVAAITRDELAAAHARWWRPDLATLVVTGGIDPAVARQLGDKLFGDWRVTGAAPALPTSRAGQPTRPRLVVIDMPGAGQAAVTAAVRGVDRADPHWFDLQVANAVLGAGSNGRLFQEVRVKRALSYGAYSSVTARADDGLLTATTQTKNESAPEVVQIFLAEFDRLGREPLDAGTVDKRKTFLAGGLSRSAETSRGLGLTIASLIQQGLPAGEAASLTTRINAVTPTGATAAAKGTVAGANANIVVVGDARLFIDRLRAIRPDLELIQANAIDLGNPTLHTTSRSSASS